MTNSHAADNLRFDGPAVYRIRIRGRIPAQWSGRLEGMTVVVDASGARPSVTTLEGELGDQASLVGVINTLYGLHLPVLSVECLG
jgi:hypothetical protein